MQISANLKALLHPKTRVAVLTGAGVSQESGVPTFRDKDGLWQKFKPEELASMSAFLKNPTLVWEWYEHRRKVIREVKPNAGHEALAKMQKYFSNFTLITQNVDGLHTRAGSKNILEVHGNLMRSYCVDCGEFAPEDFLEKIKTADEARCTKCEGRLRPDVVWFGEMLPQDIWMKSVEASEKCDLFFTIGTSAAVYPAAGLPLHAKQHGAYVVEINPQPTEITPDVDEHLRATSAIALPMIIDFCS
jgi:NAD-dependent deacetylase